MRAIDIAGIKEKVFYEKLNNGLEVYLFPMSNRHQNTATFVTKFGAKDTEFVPYADDKMIKIREGVAHFLEHRLCTDKEGDDLFTFFAKSGAYFNASTSAYRTRYYFEGTINLLPNLLHLLDSVQNAIFKEKDIEKEKGIIEQEIKRDNDNPNTILYYESMNNTFCCYPIRNNTLGSIEDIRSINRDVLGICYRTFYQPSNMFLVVTGNFNADEVIKAIRKNQSSKGFMPEQKIILKDYSEPDNVNNEYGELLYPVDYPKLKCKIKIPLTKLKVIKNYDLYLSIMFCAAFGSTSTFIETMKQKGYMAYNLTLSFNEIDRHYVVTIGAEGDQLESVITELKKALKGLDIEEEAFYRYQKSQISEEIIAYDNAINIRNYIEHMVVDYGKILNNEVERIKNLNFKEFEKVIKMADLSNVSITILKPKKII